MFQRNTFASVLLASAIALPAFAQQTAAPTAAPQQVGIEEITITARKQSENLQEAPISISAFTGETLESMGITDTQDISSIAPNTYLTQTPGSIANLALAIRGVGGAEPMLTREQGVAIYMDGAYLARVTGAVLDLVDVERVEVLRGPQGTLYGRNATGGAVNYISRKPSEEFGFRQTLGAGSYGRFQSLTRIDTGDMWKGLSATVSYLHRQRNGYVDNTLADDNSDPGSGNTDAFRIALGWDLTETIRADYSFDYAEMEGNGAAFQLIAVDTSNFGIGDPLGFPTSFANQLDVSSKRLDKLSMDFDAPSKHQIRGHNLTFEVDLGPVQLKSITTYRDWFNEENGTELDGNVVGLNIPIYDARVLPFDPFNVPFGGQGSPTIPFYPVLCPDSGPANPLPFDSCLVNAGSTGQLFAATNERDQDQWTQEINLSGAIGESFDYVTGFYFFTEKYSEENVQQFLIPVGFAAVQLATPLVYEGDATSWALFANGTYTLPLLDERLSFTGGVRYSKDEKSFVKQNLACPPLNLPPCSTYGPSQVPLMPPVTSNSATWDNIDWDVSAKFEVTEDILTYARVATGYKAGGFNLRTAQATIAPFEEESMLQYEVGIKTAWFDRRLQLNLAGFFSDYDDIQTDVFAAGPAGATSVTVNAGKAEIPGVELELLAEPFEGLRLNLNYGWINPEFKEYAVIDNNATTADLDSPFGPYDPTFDDFSVDFGSDAGWGYRPDQTLSAGIEYATPPLGSLGWVATFRLDVRWTDSLIWSPLDDERATLIQGNGVVGPACLAPAPPGVSGSATCQNGFTGYRDALTQKAYTILDARFTLSEISINERAKVRVAVFGKNITGEEYLMSGIDFGGLGFAGGVFGEPATWGIDVTLDY